MTAKNLGLIIIAALLATSCAKPAKVDQPVPLSNTDEETYYGPALGIKVAEDELKAGNYENAMQAVNDAFLIMRKLDMEKPCGTSKTRCIAYLVYGYYLRAMLHALSKNPEGAIADLEWLRNNGYMKFVSKYYKFWNEQKFDSIKNNPGFLRLVEIYRN